MLLKSWIETILEGEDNPTRLEELGVVVVTAILQLPIARTGRSWDLGTDGRSLLARHNAYVFASTEGTASKATKDAKTHAANHETTKADKTGPDLYFVTSLKASEHTLKPIVEAVEAACRGSKCVAMGPVQLADAITSHDFAHDWFVRLYGAEVEAIKHTLREDLRTEEAEARALEIGLATFGETECHEIRSFLSRTLVLQLLESEPATPAELRERLTARYRIRGLTVASVEDIATQLKKSGLVENSGQDLVRITSGGVEFLANARIRQGRSAIAGSKLVRSAVQDSLGPDRPLSNSQWAAIWNDLNDSLLTLCAARTRQVSELITRVTGNSRAAPQPTASPEEQTLQEMLESVAKRNSKGPQRAYLAQALHDAFLPGTGNAGFEWLSHAMTVYIAACSLGLTNEVHSGLRRVFGSFRFMLDTDFVVSYLCSHEVNHPAAATIVRFCKHIGVNPVVPHAVAEEVARHAMKAHVDYDMQVLTLSRQRRWYELEELQSSFTREFESLRLKGMRGGQNWTKFIARYTGGLRRDQAGKLQPNTSKMREILAGEGFRVLPSGYGQQGFDVRLADLTRAFAAHRTKFYKTENVFDALSQDKSRIDAEMFIGAEAEVEASQRAADNQHWFLVTGSAYLRALPDTVTKQLAATPTTMSIGEAALLVSLFPTHPAPVAALRALLYDETFSKSISGMQSTLLNIMRNAGSVAEVSGAGRGVLLSEFREALVSEARSRGVPPKDFRRQVRQDPVLFGQLAYAAADAMGITDAVDRAQVLDRLKGLADRLNGGVGDE